MSQAEAADTPLPFASAEVDTHDDGADEPAGGVTEGDQADAVSDVGEHEQVDLAEDDEGEDHDDHRGQCVADAAQGAHVDLIGGAEAVKQAVGADKERAHEDDIRILIEKSNDIRGEDKLKRTD